VKRPYPHQIAVIAEESKEAVDITDQESKFGTGATVLRTATDEPNNVLTTTGEKTKKTIYVPPIEPTNHILN